MKPTSKFVSLSALLLLAALLFSACAPLAIPAALTNGLDQITAQQPVEKNNSQSAAVPAAPSAAGQAAEPAAPAASTALAGSGPLSAYEDALTAVYDKVNPSVVSIGVVTGTGSNISGGQGSGFVWDKQGHIVTNNHVVEGADRIQVRFFDGTILPAELVGTDPDSDLAVIKVDPGQIELRPIELGDSASLRVGEIAIAVGNPFGLANTMTVGIVSAIGRSLSGSNTSSGPSYSNPDVIQTDAPINPGNSGGVLVDENGLLIGVPSAIESPVRANAGVGFAIPAQTVARVVPVLIKDGTYTYSWLGVTGSTLVPQIAKAMKLDESQRGVLVSAVTPSGPADKAGLRPSDQTVSIDGIDVQVGGDVITAINGQEIKAMDDLIAYLNANTRPDQQVTLSILRDGKNVDVELTLGTRPSTTAVNTRETVPQQDTIPSAYLGVSAVPLTPAVNAAIDLPSNTQGILVQKIENGSPAETAGLQGGTRNKTVDGRRILIGGDVILSIDGQPVTTVLDLRGILTQYQPGDTVSLEILRDAQPLSLEVSLTERPTQ
jgi:2-alkenal reductase